MIRWIWLLSLFSNLLLARAQSEGLTLEIGSSRDLTVPPGSILRLSQKRVLEVEELGGNQYRLIALRSGVVYVRAINSEGQLQESWMIEVIPRSAQDKSHLLRQATWREYFCGEPGVVCEPNRLRISGQTESLPWLHAARNQCEKQAPCRFAVKLTTAAQAHWTQLIQQELGRTGFAVAADGFVRLSLDCSSQTKNEQDNLRRTIQERYGAPLLLTCLSSDQSPLLLEILAVATRQSEAELDNPLHWEGLSFPAKIPLRAIVQGLSQQGRAKIIAQPQVQLSSGSQVVIADGMEIQTLLPARDHPESIWKPVGFQLQCKLIERQEQRVRLQIEMRLSRARNGAQALDSSQLQTETWVPLSEWQLIGRIRARTDGEEQSQIPWLGSLPWLGALFRWEVENQASSEVALLLRLRATDGRALPKDFDELSPDDFRDSGDGDKADSIETE